MPNKLIRGSVVLPDFYDSAIQRDDKIIDLGHQAIFDKLCGQLRYHRILFKEVVMVDQCIIDGQLLLQIDPIELFESIARPDDRDASIIQIRSRSNTLEECVYRTATRDGCIWPVSWSFPKTDNARLRIFDLTTERKGLRIDTLSDYYNLLKEDQNVRADVEFLQSGLSRWFSDDVKKFIKIKEFGSRPWQECLRLSAKLELPIEELSKNFFIKRQIPDFIKDVDKFDRNRVDGFIREKSRNASASEQAEWNTVWNWYNRVYNHCCAIQHGAAFLTELKAPDAVMLAINEFVQSSLPKSATYCQRTLSFTVVENFEERLGCLSTAAFRSLFKLPKVLEDLNEWWQNGSEDCCRRALESISNVVDKEVPIRNTPRLLEPISHVIGAATPTASIFALFLPSPYMEAVVVGSAGAQLLNAVDLLIWDMRNVHVPARREIVIDFHSQALA